MLQVLRHKQAVVTVANTLSSLEHVSNSAEVEQSQEQSNECQDIAVCANVAAAQAQTVRCHCC